MLVLYCAHAQLGSQCMLHLREAQKASQSYCIIVFLFQCWAQLLRAEEVWKGLLIKVCLDFITLSSQIKTIHLANPLRISVLSGKTFFPALNILSSRMFMQCKQRSFLLPLITREKGDRLPLVEDRAGKMNKGAREVLLLYSDTWKKPPAQPFIFQPSVSPCFVFNTRKRNSFELPEEQRWLVWRLD